MFKAVEIRKRASICQESEYRVMENENDVLYMGIREGSLAKKLMRLSTL
jgi:hypothetical protein